MSTSNPINSAIRHSFKRTLRRIPNSVLPVLLACFYIFLMIHTGWIGLQQLDGLQQHQQYHRHPKPHFHKPSLQNYIQGWNITNNVNWLLQFAIVGFPKTGTSTLMLYLQNQSSSVYIQSRERCELGYNQHVPLLVDMYKQYHPHRNLGIKCPRDLENPIARNNYNIYFPQTKFLIGLRHPILWLESFYNFRLTNGYEMIAPTRLIGRCKRANIGVCTDRAKFWSHLEQIQPKNRSIFLYHVEQLKPTTNFKQENSMPDNAAQFRLELQRFLQLPRPLTDPMLWIKPGRPNMDNNATDTDTTTTSNYYSTGKKFNICQEEFQDLRTVLLQHARNTSDWIQTVMFRDYPNLVVPSKPYFLQLLQSWEYDPCASG